VIGAGGTRTTDTVSGNGFEVVPGATNNILSYNRTSSTYLPIRWRAGVQSWEVDNTERMRIDSSGNVGIGTISPSAKLDVVGDLQVGTAATLQVASANYVGGPSFGVRYNASNARLGINIANANGFPYIGYNTNNVSASDTPTYDLSQTATQLRMDGGQFRFNIAPSGTAGNTVSFTQAMTLDADGDLGIGTTSPSRKLHVSGNVDSNFGQLIQNLNAGSSAYANLVVRNDSNKVIEVGVQSSTRTTTYPANEGWIYVSDALNVGFAGATKIYAGGAERMRIDSSGNVGIGTSSSSNRLHVQTSSSGATPFSTSPLVIERNDVNLISMLSANDTDQGILFGDVADNDIGGLFYLHLSNAMTFRTNTAERMRIDASGNVGIGTNSPVGNMQIVTATAGSVLNVNHNTGGTYPKASGIGLGATSTSLSVSSDGSTVSFTGGAGLYAENTAASGNPTNLVFWTNATGSPAERMRIDSSGNVGIGTSSPITGLECINSNGQITGRSSKAANTNTSLRLMGGAYTGNTATAILLDGISGENRLNFGGGTALGEPATSIAFHTGTAGSTGLGTERLRIDSSGNVGIGTSSPATLLHVNSSTATSQVRLTNSTGTSGFDLQTSNNAAYVYNRNNGPIIFGTNDTEQARVDATGNLLVGKTSVSGATAGFEANTGGFVATADSSFAGWMNRKTNDGDILRFNKDGTEVGAIGTSSNRIYIGTGDAGLIISSIDYVRPWNPSTNSSRDNAIDLGGPSDRFDNLYLGGGVYLGGTVAANLLDDYETGTWTPTAIGNTTAGTTTYTQQYGTYTKIGNKVTVSFNIKYTALTGTGQLNLGGLPFNVVSNANQNVNVGSVMSENLNWDVSSGSMVVMGTNNNDYMRIGFSQDDATLTLQNCVNESAEFWGSLTYFTS